MNIAIIHLFYPDLVDEVIAKTLELPVEKIIATTCEASILDYVNSKKISNLEISLVENRGMDIGPFLLSLDKVPEDCKYIYKLHTKRNEKWRKDLFEGLPIDPKNKGVYGSKKWICKDHVNYKKDKIIKLSEILGFEYPNRHFIAGTIFCIRKDILFKWIYPKKQELYDLMEFGFFNDVLESTWTHSMERILTNLCYLEKESLWDWTFPENYNGKFIYLDLDTDNQLTKYLQQFSDKIIITNNLNSISNYKEYFIFSCLSNPFSRIINIFNNQKKYSDFNSFCKKELIKIKTQKELTKNVNMTFKFFDINDCLELIFKFLEINNYKNFEKTCEKNNPINISLSNRNSIKKHFEIDFEDFQF